MMSDALQCDKLQCIDWPPIDLHCVAPVCLMVAAQGGGQGGEGEPPGGNGEVICRIYLPGLLRTRASWPFSLFLVLHVWVDHCCPVHFLTWLLLDFGFFALQPPNIIGNQKEAFKEHRQPLPSASQWPQPSLLQPAPISPCPSFTLYIHNMRDEFKHSLKRYICIESEVDQSNYWRTVWGARDGVIMGRHLSNH